jgi:D-alanyl-D-alanine carboxypeptidase
MPRPFDVPGSQFAYSNTNTIILGRILEKVTGQSYRTLLQRRLLGPLAMKRSFLDISGNLWKPHVQTYSKLYGMLMGGPPLLRTTDWSLSTGWSAGGLASTLADLRSWAHALGTGQGVLQRATQRSRTGDCMFNGTNGTLTQEYCLGVAIIRENSSGDVVTYLHNGTMVGATSYVAYYPRTGAILVVLANQDAPSGPLQLTIPDKVSFAVGAAVPELLGIGS